MASAHDEQRPDGAAGWTASALRMTRNVEAWMGGAAASGVVRYDTIPFLAMVVNAAQLERLIADQAVVSIQEDIPVGLNTR